MFWLSDVPTFIHVLLEPPTLINTTSTVVSPLAQKLYRRLCLSYMLHRSVNKHTSPQLKTFAPLSPASFSTQTPSAAKGGVPREEKIGRLLILFPPKKKKKKHLKSTEASSFATNRLQRDKAGKVPKQHLVGPWAWCCTVPSKTAWCLIQ